MLNLRGRLKIGLGVFKSRWSNQTPQIRKNPTSQELEQLASNGQVRAILDVRDAYAWDPTTAFHDAVFKSLGLDETAIYAIMDVGRRTVRVVRGSQVQVSRARVHPYIKKLAFEVADE
jgi:hypothetical protein